MATIAELMKAALPVAKSPLPQQPQQENWVSNLISERYQPQTERIKRNPVGFDFKREPFDPSSYYNAINLHKNINSAATAVVKQEVANKQESIQKQELLDAQNASKNALSGVNANYTYSSGPGSTDSNYTPNGSSRKYGLKRVSPNTGRAADYWGSKYGIKSIGGYAAHGSVPGSDHPKGLALDFMINNIKNGHKTGTALANDVIANYKAWNVKYVIWNRYIWFPGRGWHRYSGPSPHTDHVHVSFNK